MNRLAARITQELKVVNHSAVYKTELERFWPENGKKRERAVKEWPERHCWRVRFYKDGFCAIFDKDPNLKDGAGIGSLRAANRTNSKSRTR